MSHYAILQAALSNACICGGRAIAAWEEILTINGMDVVAYCKSISEMFAHGGGKDLNHFYIVPPSSGKTVLNRPVLELFGSTAFAKPQVHTTFALAGLIGAKAVIWNDFYWPHPPLAWGDLLNLLDNEGFGVGLPKGDGQTDHPWNTKGDENVIAMLTSNKEVVYVADNTVDEVRTNAWKERFGPNILHFNKRLPKPDRRYKVWLKCTRCYAHWILSHEAAPEPAEDVFGFGGGFNEASDSSAGAAPVPPGVPQEQQDAIARNRAAAVTRRAARAQAQPQRTAERPTHAEDPDRSRSARGAASAAAPPAAVVLPTVPLLSIAAPAVCAMPPQEPVRDLNKFLHKHQMEAASFDSCLEDATLGLWHCQASAGGVSARGTGHGKNAAKREAAKELLRALSELAQGGSKF